MRLRTVGQPVAADGSAVHVRWAGCLGLVGWPGWVDVPGLQPGWVIADCSDALVAEKKDHWRYANAVAVGWISAAVDAVPPDVGFVVVQICAVNSVDSAAAAIVAVGWVG